MTLTLVDVEILRSAVVFCRTRSHSWSPPTLSQRTDQQNVLVSCICRAHTCLRRLRREGDRASRYAQRHHFCVAAEYVLESWAQTMCGNPHLTSER